MLTDIWTNAGVAAKLSLFMGLPPLAWRSCMRSGRPNSG